MVTQMHSSLSALDEKLTNHMLDEPRELAACLADIMNKGFPSGDLEGHRKYHEAQIKAIEARTKFWEDMRTELGKHTLRALLVVMGALALYYWNGHVVLK